MKVVLERPDSFLYPLQSDIIRRIYTGTIRYNCQFLMGPSNEDAVILYFNAAGDLLRTKVLPMPRLPAWQRASDRLPFHLHFCKLQDEEDAEWSSPRKVDSKLRVFPFVLRRGDVPQRRVSALIVVEDLDVLDDRGAGLRPRGEVGTMD